jgi:hypothetical protein
MNSSWHPVFVVSILIVMALASSPCAAGEAFFSRDGGTVTMGAGEASAGLVQVDIATGRITEAPLPAELKDAFIESVAGGSEGEALFLANDAVWVWTPGAAGPSVKRVCDTAPVDGATDLFVATVPGTPLTDCLFVTGREKDDTTSMGTLYGRKPGGKAFSSIFCRRVSDATGGVFSSDGRLFFVSNGDLWEGGIQVEEDAEIDRLGTLVGARIAPLAILNTDEANGGGMWVNGVAPAGKWLYVKLAGRHMATILRIPMPAKPLYAPNQDDFPTLEAQVDAMIQSLSHVEIITDDLENAFGFCATEVDGIPRVFFCSRTGVEGKGPAMMLWEGTGEARVIGYFPER